MISLPKVHYYWGFSDLLHFLLFTASAAYNASANLFKIFTDEIEMVSLHTAVKLRFLYWETAIKSWTHHMIRLIVCRMSWKEWKDSPKPISEQADPSLITNTTVGRTLGRGVCGGDGGGGLISSIKGDDSRGSPHSHVRTILVCRQGTRQQENPYQRQNDISSFFFYPFLWVHVSVCVCVCMCVCVCVCMCVCVCDFIGVSFTIRFVYTCFCHPCSYQLLTL